jgi:hypothetical protein
MLPLDLNSLLGYWPVFAFCFSAALFRELMEHSRDDKWQESFWGKAAPHFLNSGRKGKAHLHKHNWKPSWLWSTWLVWATDGEHLFQALSTLSVYAALYFATEHWWVVGLAFLGFNALGLFKELFLKSVS